MNKEAALIGLPFPFQDILKVYPPTVEQIITTDDYPLFLKVLTSSQEDLEDEFLEKEMEISKVPTPLEYILINSYHNKDFYELVKQAFLFFTHEKITFLFDQKQIVIGDLEKMLSKISNIAQLQQIPTLSEDNFLDFQNAIRDSVGLQVVSAPDPNEHPKIKEMKRKARYRDKIKAKHNKGNSLDNTIASICCMGIGITPLNVGKISYVALQMLMARYQAKEQYDIDIRSILAGADSKKVKPHYWMGKLQD